MTASLTKKAIQRAFVKLLNEQPLNKISVKDITDECGINRNSFYYHYRDIPGLIEEILTEQIDRIIDRYMVTESLDEFFDEAFEFAISNRKALYHVYDSSYREIFIDMLLDASRHIAASYVNEQFEGTEVSDRDRDLIIRFVAYGCFGVYVGWMREGMKENVLEDIHRIIALSRGMTEELIRRCEV